MNCWAAIRAPTPKEVPQNDLPSPSLPIGNPPSDFPFDIEHFRQGMRQLTEENRDLMGAYTATTL